MNMRETRMIPDGLPAIFRAVDDYRVVQISNLILFEHNPDEVDEAAMLAADVAEDYGLEPEAMNIAINIHREPRYE